jgi:hypothetical protein
MTLKPQLRNRKVHYVVMTSDKTKGNKKSKTIQALQNFRLRYFWKNITTKTNDNLHSTCDSIETDRVLKEESRRDSMLKFNNLMALSVLTYGSEN